MDDFTISLGIFGSIVVSGLFLLSFMLWLRAKDVHPFSDLTDLIRLPKFELFLVLFIVGGFVQYGATKGTNGNGRGQMSMPSRSVASVSPIAVDSTGFSMPTNFPSVTNLCFWGIEKDTNAVAFGIAWPTAMLLTNDIVDLFGNAVLAASNWNHLAEVDVSGALSNAIVEIGLDDIPTNMTEKAFFRVASQGDFDGDGLSDALEEWVIGTNPENGDTDGDGLGDGYELSIGLNPSSNNSDSDSLGDGEELGWWEYGGTLPVFDVSGGEQLLDPYDYYYSGSFRRQLPFPICCAGYVHYDVTVTVDGVIALMTDRYSSNFTDDRANQDYSTHRASPYNTVIAAYWDDLYVPSNSGAQITVADVQTNGQRYAVIEYTNMRLLSQSNDPSCVATFQIVIPESDQNTIYVHYIDMSQFFNGSSATIGAQLPNRERVFPVAFNRAGSVHNGMVIAYHFGTGSNPLTPDSDGDGLSDHLEASLGSSSRYDDTDLDGMPDFWEYTNGLDPFSRIGDDGADGDPDGDLLANIKEYALASDPFDPDTDVDGLFDGLETGYVCVTNGIPWLTFDSYVDVTTLLSTSGQHRAEIPLDGLYRVQGEAVTNITMYSDGTLLLNKPGYLRYGQSPGVNSPNAAVDRDALLLAPCKQSANIRSDIPGLETLVRYGAASYGGEGYLLFEYINIHYNGSTIATNAISFQIAIPTNGFDRAYSRYRDVIGSQMDGRNAYIGLQTMDGIGLHTYCYNKSGMIFDGLALEFRFGVNSDPTKADTDCDGLSDPEEFLLGTKPRDPDSDGDGMNDGWEHRYAAAGFDPLVINSASADPDGDGLTNAQECEWDTDPYATDSDGDGVSDGTEVAQNSDPGDAGDGGLANSRISVPFRFGDPSSSTSEKYRLEVSPATGSGSRPRSFSWLNAHYGQCETKTAMLKPGWKYEVRLYHASCNRSGAGYPDYDYQLDFGGAVAPRNVILDDPDGLFGTYHTSTNFVGAGKVAYIYVLPSPRLVANYDRDDDIDSDDEAAHDGGATLRFWVNDDNDTSDVNDSENDIPGSGANGQDDVVNGRGDLIDFTPVLIDMSGVVPNSMPPAIKNRISWRLESDSVNVVWSALSADVAGKFQRENRGAVFGPSLSQNVHEASVTNLSGGAVMPEAFLSHMAASGDKGVILIEGRAAGTNLVLRGYLDNSTSAFVEGRLNLCVSSVEDMYRWLNLRAVCGDGSGRVSSLGNPTNFPDAESDGRHFVFVHGYNVNYQSARGWSAEMFKRLWQAGSKSMFTAVDWFGNDSQIWQGVPIIGGESLDYYVNVRHSLDSALNFSVAVNALPGNKVMLAHSLGNMLVSEAAKFYLLDYSKYYMLNAAVPMEAYDSTATEYEMIEHGWRDVNPVKWAANWHECVTYPNDPRQYLKWKGRFSGIHDTVNCYSSTEDILANATASGWGGLWGAQELFKGTATLLFVPGNCEGGWGYNSDHTNLYGLLTEFAKTNNFTNAELIASPLFRMFDNAVLHQTNVISIAQTELNKVMGDGIPALSFAAGANPIETGVSGNVMLSPNESTCWPDVRINDNDRLWLHSDIRSLAFFYVNFIFKKIVDGEIQ